MINKRLIGIIGENKKYIVGNVLLQWCCLVANISMITAITILLSLLYKKAANSSSIVITIVVAIVTILVRFICTISSNHMGYLSSKAVKGILREKIYQKLLLILAIKVICLRGLCVKIY